MLQDLLLVVTSVTQEVESIPGVNYQCLHTEPEYNTYYSSSGSFSVISGAEYE